MNNNKLKDNDFINKYMYTDKTSKNPYLATIFQAILGLGIIFYGVYLYLQLGELENTGGEIRINRIFSFIYDIAGKIGVLASAVVLGSYFLYKGYETYKVKTS